MPTATQQYQCKALREKRGEIKTRIEALGSKLRTENRAMTAEEKSAFDQLKTDFATVSESIRAAETDMAALDQLLSADYGDQGGDNADPNTAPADPAADGGANSRRVPGKQNRNTDTRPRGDGTEAARTREDRALALQAWCRSQHGLPLKRKHAEACKRAGVNPHRRHYEIRIGGPGSRLQKRTLNVGTGSAGGDLIAPDFVHTLEQSMKDYSNVRGVVDQFTTDTAVALPYPTEDDTSATGAQINENAETGFVDDSFGLVTFYGWKYTSNGVLVSYELMNDSAFNLESVLGSNLGIRLGRATGADYTNGSGTNTPQGIITAAGVGVTAASATAFTADELTRLAFSIDPAYRSDPSFGYMMHDTTLAYAILLKDSYGRPLLRDSYRDGITIPILNGYPVNPNQFMDACTGTGGIPVTAKKHVLCGAFAKHKIRDVGTIRLRRLDERYAEKDQVGFIAFMRTDSRCINTSALKVLQQA